MRENLWRKECEDEGEVWRGTEVGWSMRKMERERV